jgi:hypothetical protein
MVDRSQPSEKTGRVVPFRPRGAHGRGFYPPGSKNPRPPISSLGRYERGNETDDFRHRTVVNVLAFAFIVMLTAAGVWLADSLAALRKTQDCLLSGRRNCAMIDFNRPPAPAARDQYVRAR